MSSEMQNSLWREFPKMATEFDERLLERTGLPRLPDRGTLAWSA